MRVPVVAAGAIVALGLGAGLYDMWQTYGGTRAPALSSSRKEARAARPTPHGDGAGLAAQRMTALQSQRLNAMDDDVAALNERLNSLESAQGAQDTQGEHAEGAPDAEGSRPPSDGILLDWMNHRLASKTSDRGRTVQVEDQIKKILPVVPGVRLDQAQCDEKFCRAVFARDDGEQADVMPLFGEGPPFVSQAMTQIEDDGRVAVYFTSKDVSLDALRAEASQAAVE